MRQRERKKMRGEGGREKERGRQREREPPEEPENKAKVGNGMARNEPGRRWVKGQLRNWFCRHHCSFPPACFAAYLANPEVSLKDQVVLEGVATADMVGGTSRKKSDQQSGG